MTSRRESDSVPPVLGGGLEMRGSDERTGSLFSFVDLEERVPQRHPLRKIRHGELQGFGRNSRGN